MGERTLERFLRGVRVGELGCLTLGLALALSLSVLLLCGAAQKPSVKVQDFYFSPAGETSLPRSEYAWPEDSAIDAVAVVETEGYSGELRLDLYLVIFDEDEAVVAKQRSKHSLKAGTYTLTFPAALDAARSFGSRRLTAKVEAALKGGGSDMAQAGLSLSGPDAPEVDFIDLRLYNPARGRDSDDFAPGELFVFEALFEISGNPGGAVPSVLVYAMLEEDGYQLDPELDYQPYDNHWDIAQPASPAGQFRLRAAGRLPRFFAEPWEHRHPLRVYIYVNFSPEASSHDYTRAEVFDAYPGENRRNDDLAQRLVELDRAYKWELRRLRPGSE